MHVHNNKGKERLEDVSVAHNQECTTLVLFSLKLWKPFRFREACSRRFLFKAERKRQVFIWLYLHGYRCWAWRLPLSKMSVQRQVSWRRMWSEELHLLSPWDNLQTRCKICKWSTILPLPPMDYSGKKGCCVTSKWRPVVSADKIVISNESSFWPLDPVKDWNYPVFPIPFFSKIVFFDSS